ncbi:Alpha/Beta hydrolase protein [Coniochaeta sp. 2T2.1]|nr:Alpha/Beta hydrolase protein [Coniochaeta sp. 2T2.1]
MSPEPIHATVLNEKCLLHYWTLGTSGPLITFIPGGNGHGRQFFPLMQALSGQYTTLTFDRRQMSDSQLVPGQPNKRLNPPQQARDVRAVILALGGGKFEKSVVFGSSSGGIFAFQFAHDFPDMVSVLIAHEAPTVTLLPEASEVVEWFLHLLDVFDEHGWEAAQREFGEKLIGYDDEGVPKTVSPDRRNPVNFWENEFPVLLGYVPNLWRVREHLGGRIGLMRGVRCREAFFARTTVEQGKILGAPVVTAPGHHQGFEVEVEEFLPVFLGLLETLKEGKGSV